MREMHSLDAAAQFEELLDEIERGEIVTIIRRGRTIARIVPEPLHARKRTREEIAAAFERFPAVSRANSAASASTAIWNRAASSQTRNTPYKSGR